MSITIDNAENFIINEINKALEENRIFSFVSEKFQWLKNNSIFHDMGSILFGHNSYTSLVNDLGNCINRLPNNKTIVISFEDIDRLSSKEEINKIFSISETLFNICNIKVIFQYDEKKLLSILEEKKTYLEKFIPYTINLTEISLKRMIEEKLKTGKYENIANSDFEFLFETYSIPEFIYCDFETSKIDMNSFSFQIRIVEIFLEEINLAFARETYKTFADYKKIIVLFYFIKHFEYELYCSFQKDKLFINESCFNFDYENYTIFEILNGKIEAEYLNELFNDNKNKRYLGYLIQFGFDLSIFEKNEMKPQNASTYFLKKQSEKIDKELHNEKINQLIHNLFANGKSEYTSFEKLYYDILSILKNNSTDRIKLFDKYICKDEIKDILQEYPDHFIPIFKSFNLYEHDSENWLLLIDFYFNIYHSDRIYITQDFLSILSCINFTDRRLKNVFIKTLDLFNSDKCVFYSNFHNSSEYNYFISHFLEGLLWNGYYYEDYEWRYTRDPYFFGPKLELTLLAIINTLRKQIDDIYSKKLNENLLINELNSIISFLEKNIQLRKFSESEVTKKMNSDIHMDETSETEQLIRKFEDLPGEELREIIPKEYENGRITSIQYRELLHLLDDKTQNSNGD